MAREALQSPGHDSGDWAQEQNCFTAGLDIALILAELQVGSDCLLAGILYRAVREQRVAPERVSDSFGAGVARLIEGVTRMAAIGELSVPRRQAGAGAGPGPERQYTQNADRPGG